MVDIWWIYGNHAPCSHVEISELITFSRCPRWSGQCCVGSSSRIPAQLTPGTWHHGSMASWHGGMEQYKAHRVDNWYTHNNIFCAMTG